MYLLHITSQVVPQHSTAQLELMALRPCHTETGADVTQVVHLYQELRKLMGDETMVRDLNSQDPAASMLRGRGPFQALTAADEQARQRSLADNPAALQVGLCSGTGWALLGFRVYI